MRRRVELPAAQPRHELVVSGCSSGIGAATARRLAAQGYHVLAGVYAEGDAKHLRADGIEPLLLDITDPHHVTALARRVADDPEARPLRALVNNAGIEINAPVEVQPLEVWRQQLEVNLLGHIAVIQALLPALRRSRGSIVNISSVGGKVALPNYGAYAASKFALEAASDALRREVKAQGIRVVVVQPGGVNTEMAARSGPISLAIAERMSPDHALLYGDLVRAAVASQTRFLENAIPAEKAAEKIASIVRAARPRARYTLGSDAALVVPLARILPDRALDAMLGASRRPVGGRGPRSHVRHKSSQLQGERTESTS